MKLTKNIAKNHAAVAGAVALGTNATATTLMLILFTRCKSGDHLIKYFPIS